MSDEPGTGEACDGDVLPATAFNGTSSSLPYSISCRNDSPVADAGQDIVFGPGTSVVVLDGRGSSDTETPPNELTLQWRCNTGFGPPGGVVLAQFEPVGSVVQCPLPPGVADATYTPALTVTDRGDGTSSPGGGFNCVKSSTDTVNVTILPSPVGSAGDSGEDN